MMVRNSMTKKKENKKKKEEKVLYVSNTHCTDGKCITSSWWGKKRKRAKPRDLTIESYRKPENIDIVFKHRINAQVIDAPTQYIMIFPKDLPSAGLGCAIYNALEKERGSNVVWRLG